MSRAATDEVDWAELWNKIGRRYDEPQNAERILNAARALFDDVPDDAVDRAVERDVLERTDEGVRLTGVPEEDTEEDADEDESDGTHPRRDATESDEDGGIYEYDAVPDELKEHDIWLMWDSDSETPRRPHWRGDFGISWSNPNDWHSFEEAVEAAQERESWGIGYVNALDNDDAPREIFSTIDIDGALNEDGSHNDWLPPMEVFLDNGVYVEKSASGIGYHIPLVGYEPPEWWTDTEVEDAEHEGVELLTNKFCAVTGDKVVGSGDEVGDIDVTPWLEEVWARIQDTAPEQEGDQTDLSHEYDGDFTEEVAREALEYINPDVSYDTWRDIGFALVGEFGEGLGGRLFKDWSRGGSKWDSQAEKQAERIANDADNWDYSAGTVVYHAKQGGWEPDFGSSEEKNETPDEPQTYDETDGVDVDNWVSKAGVKHVAGLGENESISDLNDREKAACVWELVKKSENYHVRYRRENGELWTYDGGVWVPEGERTLRHAARQAVGSMNLGDNVLNELKSQVRSDLHAEVEADEFGVETGKVAVRNGLLDLDKAAEGHRDDALRELRPEDYALVRLPVEYDPNADYDEWHDLVKEWAEDGRADALQEYVGYCLHVGELPIHRALLLVGGGANGKSTFLEVVKLLLGEENITSTELQTLANKDYAKAEFEGKLANIDEDLSGRKLGGGIGMFKKLIAGNQIRARRPYGSGFTYTPTGKQLYAANEVPDVSNVAEDDEGFWRRWLLVEFPNHYSVEERDPQLADRLTTSEHLSAVLNWAIDGRSRLLEQGHFTGECISAFEKRDRWQSWGDSVDEFLLDHVFSDEDADNVSTGYVHDRYRAWCRENSKDTVGQRKLTSRLKNWDEDFGYARSVRVSDTTGQPNGFKSISFSDKVPEVEEVRDDGQEGIDGFGGGSGD